MPNPDPKQKSSKKTISHADYTQKLVEQQANEKDTSFAGNEFYRLFGYQQKLKGGTRKKNKRKRKTYKRKCK